VCVKEDRKTDPRGGRCGCLRQGKKEKRNTHEASTKKAISCLLFVGGNDQRRDSGGGLVSAPSWVARNG